MPISHNYQARMRTPFGMLGIVCNERELAGIDFLTPEEVELRPANALAREVVLQLEAYFDDPDYEFNLPYKLQGTPFQRRLWQAMCEIRRGQTQTYGALAANLNSAPRAVGQTCGANPLPIIVPCHRVVSKQGLGGFANHTQGYTLEIKRWLLLHEQVALPSVRDI